MMQLDNILWIAGSVAEAAVVALLIYRRGWRTFPIFFVFCAWDLLGSVGSYVVLHFFPGGYVTTYLIETVVVTALEFSVLIELAWSVLRPIRASLPRSSPIVIALIVLAAGAAIWPISGLHQIASVNSEMRNIVRVQQTASMLRILFFVLLAGCSQLLSIGWRDRELQVATGLGFYSLVSLSATILHSQQMTTASYSHLYQVVVASYLCSLLYWVFSFAQKEAVRREFTPQMQSFLLAVAGSARATRLEMTGAPVEKPTESRKR